MAQAKLPERERRSVAEGDLLLDRTIILATAARIPAWLHHAHRSAFDVMDGDAV